MRKLDAKELAKKPAAGLVRVKILKFVGTFTPGDVVECDKEKAEQLCSKSQINLGEGAKTPHIRAMLLSEAEELEERAVDMRAMSQAEMAELGKQNVVLTPKDPAFEARLANLRKLDEEFADGKVVPPIDGEGKEGEDGEGEGLKAGEGGSFPAQNPPDKKFVNKKEEKQPQAGA